MTAGNSHSFLFGVECVDDDEQLIGDGYEDGITDHRHLIKREAWLALVHWMQGSD